MTPMLVTLVISAAFLVAATLLLGVLFTIATRLVRANMPVVRNFLAAFLTAAAAGGLYGVVLKFADNTSQPLMNTGFFIAVAVGAAPFIGAYGLRVGATVLMFIALAHAWNLVGGYVVARRRSSACLLIAHALVALGAMAVAAGTFDWLARNDHARTGTTKSLIESLGQAAGSDPRESGRRALAGAGTAPDRRPLQAPAAD